MSFIFFDSKKLSNFNVGYSTNCEILLPQFSIQPLEDLHNFSNPHPFAFQNPFFVRFDSLGSKFKPEDIRQLGELVGSHKLFLTYLSDIWFLFYACRII